MDPQASLTWPHIAPHSPASASVPHLCAHLLNHCAQQSSSCLHRFFVPRRRKQSPSPRVRERIASPKYGASRPTAPVAQPALASPASIARLQRNPWVYITSPEGQRLVDLVGHVGLAHPSAVFDTSQRWSLSHAHEEGYYSIQSYRGQYLSAKQRAGHSKGLALKTGRGLLLTAPFP